VTQESERKRAREKGRYRGKTEETSQVLAWQKNAATARAGGGCRRERFMKKIGRKRRVQRGKGRAGEKEKYARSWQKRFGYKSYPEKKKCKE